MFKRLLKLIAWLLALVALLCGVMYAAHTPEYAVPATVLDDASLPSIRINGVKLHAESFGPADAPVVIVLHGGPGNDYRSLLPLQALSDRYRVVFYDQRGAGLSQRMPASALGLDDYVAELDGVVEHYSPRRPVVLIGHSWGAMLATAYLRQYPHKVSGAVLAEPGFLNSELADQFYARTHGMMPPITADLLWQVARTGFETLHVRGPDSEAATDYLIERIAMGTPLEGHPIAGYFCGGKLGAVPMWRLGGTAMLATQGLKGADGHFHIDLVSGLDRYDGRVLFLSGSCNTLTGPEHQAKQIRFFRNASMRIIQGAGHLMFSEKPDESLGAVRSFLSGTP